MTDPMEALRHLQFALTAREVELQPCELYPEIKVLLDHPNDIARFTYALLDGSKVQAVALFAMAAPIEGLTCFNIGYAVAEQPRGKGIASSLLERAIKEMAHGFSRTPMKAFYIEAIVSTLNEPSNRIAGKLVSATREEGTDAFSGEPIYQYVRKVECAA